MLQIGLPGWKGKQRRRECCFGGLNSMSFECVLRHYHPRLFLHIWWGSRNLFPQPVLDDMGHITDTAHAEERWTNSSRLRTLGGWLLALVLDYVLIFNKKEIKRLTDRCTCTFEAKSFYSGFSGGFSALYLMPVINQMFSGKVAESSKVNRLSHSYFLFFCYELKDCSHTQCTKGSKQHFTQGKGNTSIKISLPVHKSNIMSRLHNL